MIGCAPLASSVALLNKKLLMLLEYPLDITKNMKVVKSSPILWVLPNFPTFSMSLLIFC